MGDEVEAGVERVCYHFEGRITRVRTKPMRQNRIHRKTDTPDSMSRELECSPARRYR